MEKKHCKLDSCNKVFAPKDSDHVYCSVACAREGSKKHQMIKCKREGCTVVIKSWPSAPRVYCSYRCHAQDRTIKPDKKCPECGGMYSPNNMKQKYCSNPCKISAARKANKITPPKRRISKYTDELRDQMIAGWNYMEPEEMSAVLGFTVQAIKRQIGHWRQAGFKIPDNRNKPIGHRSVRKHGVYIKTATGWEREKTGIRPARPPKPRKIKVAKPKPPKAEKPITQSELADARRMHRQQQLERERLPNRTIDLTGKERVYVPSLKAHVWLKTGKTLEGAMGEYLEARRHLM